MDCKTIRRVLHHLDDFDEKSLDINILKHLAECVECKRELDWLKMLQKDLRGLRLSEPNPEFQVSMARSVQFKLMLEQVNRPSISDRIHTAVNVFPNGRMFYGLAAVLVAVICGIFFYQSKQTSLEPQITQSGFQSYAALSTSLHQIDPSITRVLDYLSEPELNVCVQKLIRRSFNRNDMENIADDPVILTDLTVPLVMNDSTIDGDFQQLGRRELRRLSTMLNERYQR